MKKRWVLHENPFITTKCFSIMYYINKCLILAHYDACLKMNLFFADEMPFCSCSFSKDQPNALKIACTFMMWHFHFTNQYRNQYWRINFAERKKKKPIKNIFHSVCIANFSNIWFFTPKMAQIAPPIFMFCYIRVLAWRFKRICLKNKRYQWIQIL